jgi:hypothetical protein
MKKRIIHHNIALPADHQTTIITQPGKSSFNLPAPPITAQLTPIVITPTFIVAAVRANQFDAALRQSPAMRVAVIGFVGDNSTWFFPWSAWAFPRHRDLIYRFFEQRDFRRGRRVQVVSQRNTLAVDHHHPLRSLAAFGLSDALTPFFAGAKLPSANASLQSSCPSWSSSERKARHASSQMSRSSQSLSRLQQVDGLGNCFGKSAQGAPVRSIQRMPSNTLRLLAQGLPPRFDFLVLAAVVQFFPIVNLLISIFVWP